MGKIIAIASQAGGVGKTTICLNLGVALTDVGKKVLLIDTDPQGTLALTSNLTSITRSGLTQLLRGEAQEEDIVTQAGARPLFLVGSGVNDLTDLGFFQQECEKGHLDAAIKGLATGFDFVLIDTQTGLHRGLPPLIEHCDSLLLPCTCQARSIRTLPLFLQLIQKIRTGRNPALALEGVLLNMVKADNPIAAAIKAEIEDSFPGEIFFSGAIPLLSSLEVAAFHAVPVALLKNAPLATQAFASLAAELIARNHPDKE